jgi:hypothetical protein
VEDVTGSKYSRICFRNIISKERFTMSRNIALLVALSVVTASSAASTAAFPHEKTAPTLTHAARHISKVSDRRSDGLTHRHREALAMAPTEAELAGWRVKVASADASAQTPQDSAHVAEAEPGSSMNVYGMLIAALGLGLMSIVRRMGRF